MKSFVCRAGIACVFYWALQSCNTRSMGEPKAGLGAERIHTKAERTDGESRIVRYFVDASGNHVRHGPTMVFRDGQMVGDTERYWKGQLMEVSKGAAHRHFD